jgi:hypothetical protein
MAMARGDDYNTTEKNGSRLSVFMLPGGHHPKPAPCPKPTTSAGSVHLSFCVARRVGIGGFCVQWRFWVGVGKVRRGGPMGGLGWRGEDRYPVPSDGDRTGRF